MKIFLALFLLAGYAQAQTLRSPARRDSLPGGSGAGLMPSVRPSNSFYRDPRDSPNVMRATLDNMPIHVPDSSVTYTIQQSKQQYRMPLPRPKPPRRKE